LSTCPAWAHLILYGEEATKKAEKEGEEAVTAWEQELKDIAEGKVIEKPKPEKKKGKPGPKKGINKGAKVNEGKDPETSITKRGPKMKVSASFFSVIDSNHTMH
jgi:hypothetical protein